MASKKQQPFKYVKKRSKTSNERLFIRNVLSSVGYISVTAIKSIDPEITSYVSDQASTIKDAFETAKDFKNIFKSKADDIKGSSTFQLGKDYATNAWEDLRSGKFYNPDRQKKNEDAFMKQFTGFDMDDFDDLDFSDLDDNDEDFSVKSTDVYNASNQITGGIQHGAMSATTNLINNSRHQTENINNNNNRGFKILNTSILGLTSSVLSMQSTFSKPLSDHIINSTKFYETATVELSKQTQLLESINANLTQYLNPQKAKSQKESSYSKLFGYGMPGLSDLAETAKNNFNNSDYGMLINFAKDMVGDLEMMRGTDEFNSPIGYIIGSAIGRLIGSGKTGRGLDRLKKGMRLKAIKTAGRIHERAKGDGFLGILAKLFDVIPTNKDTGKINVGKYDKGPTRWTGMNDMALRKVIPETLVSILYALTKNKDDIRLFNYETGKWEKRDKVMGNHLKAKIKNASQATSEFTNDWVKDWADQNGKASYGYEATQLNNDVTVMMGLLGISNLNPMTCTKSDAEKYLRKFVANKPEEGKQISTKNFKMLLDAFWDSPNSKNNATMVSAVYAARDANNRFVDNENAFMNTASIQNGSVINNAGKSAKTNGRVRAVDQAASILGTDDRGHSLFFYLQRMTMELSTMSYIAQNGGFGGGGGGIAIDRNALTRYASISRAGAVRLTTRGALDGGNFSVARQAGIVQGRRFSKKGAKSNDNLSNEQLKRKLDNGSISEEEYNRIIQNRQREDFEAEQRRASNGSSVIDSITNWMDRRLFGDAPRAIKKSFQEKGLFGFLTDIPNLIVNGFKSVWSDIKTKFTNSEFGKKYLGELKSAPLNAVKSMAKDAWASIKNTGSTIRRGWKSGAYSDRIQTAYNGGEVTRSGVVSVSEGELILPAEMNPNYKGYISKGRRKDIERNNARDYRRQSKGAGSYLPYWGEFAGGGTATAKLSKEEQDKLKSEKRNTLLRKERLRNRQKKKTENRTRRAEADTPTGQFIHELVDSEVIQDLDGVLYGIYDKLIEISGGDEKREQRKDKAKSAWEEIKPLLPKALAKGTIGAAIGGIAAGPLGILGGFTVGAGMTLINDSTKISEKLFGKYEEGKDGQEGEWTGGKLPKPLANFIKKQLPGYAKAGGIGAIAGAIGLVPGGALGGLVLGAGINAIKGSETFKELLFGGEGLDGKRRGGLVGELKYTIVDPLSSWAKEQIGEKGENIKKYMNENLFKPLKHLGTALKDFAKGFSKSTLGKINKLFKTAYVKLGDVIQHTTNPVIRGIGKAGNKVFGAAKAVGKLPGKIVNKAASEIDILNIRKGYSSMSAAERLALSEERYGGPGVIAETGANPDNTHTTDIGFRFGRKKVGVDAYDKWAASASIEDLEQANIFENGESEVENRLFNLLATCQSTLQSSLVNAGNNPKRVGRGTYNKDIQKFFEKPKYTGKHLKAQRNAGIKDGKVYASEKDIMKILSAAMKEGQMTKELFKMAKDFVREQFPKINKLIDKWWDYDATGKDVNDTWSKSAAGQEYLKTRSKDKSIMSRHKSQLSFDLENMKKREGPSAAFKNFKDIQDDEQAKEAAKQAVANDPVESRKMSLLEVIKVTLKDVAEGVKGIINKPIKDAAMRTPLGPGQLDPASLLPGPTTSSATTPLLLTGPTIHKDKNGRWRDEKGRFTAAPEESGSGSGLFRYGGASRNVRYDDKGHKQKLNDEGEWVDDTSDSNTAVALREEQREKEEKSSFYKFFTDKKNGLMTKLSSFLSGFSGKEGEDKKSGGILGLLGGLFSGISSLFKGGISTLMGGLSNLGGVIGNIGLGAAAAGAVILPQVGKATAGGKYDANVRKETTEEEKAQMKEDAKNAGYFTNLKGGMDVVENMITGKDMTTYSKDDFVSEHTSNKINKNIVGNVGVRLLAGGKLAKGVKSVGKFFTPKVVKDVTKTATKVVKGGGKVLAKAKTVIGPLAKKLAGSKAGKAIGQAASKAASTIAEKALPIFKRMLTKLGLSNVDDAATAITKEVAENVAKKGGAALAKNLAKVCFWLTIAQIVLAFEDGMENAMAKTILQIVDEPTFVERVVAASCHALNEAIPVIGGIIPTHILFTLVYKVLGLVGIKFDDLEQKRQNAKKVVEEYNAQNGTTYNIEEYIHNVLGEYTTQQKIKRGVGKVVTGIKNFFTGKKSSDETTKTTTTTTTTTQSSKDTVTTPTQTTNANTDVSSGSGSGIRYAGKVNYVGGSSNIRAVGHSVSTLSKFRGSISKAVAPLSADDYTEGQGGIFGAIKGAAQKFGEKTIESVMRATVLPKVKTFFKVCGEDLFKAIYDGLQKYPISTIAGTIPTIESDGKTGDESGSGAHVSQMELGNRKFGRSTVASSGCGPAVAATILRQYGRSGDLGSAATYAERHGYVAGSSGVGTKSGYFRDILGRSGISTAYTDSKKDISRAIESGRPTILLGQDSGNHSKSNSPFGPNPHYVVARGAGKGSVFVDDPELGSTAIYPRSAIERGANLGIATGGASALIATKQVADNFIENMGEDYNFETDTFDPVVNKLKIKYKSKAISKIKKLGKNKGLEFIKSKALPLFKKLLTKLGVANADDVAVSVTKAVSENIAVKGGKKLLSAVAKVSAVLSAAAVALAFEDGMEDAQAKTILQIIDKPSLIERLVSGACHALNAAIPVIGNFIPTRVIFTIIYDVLRAMGFEFAGLQEKREKAKKVVEAYNKQNGTSYSIEEYIHNVLGEYTTQQRWRSFKKNTIKKVKNALTGGIYRKTADALNGAVDTGVNAVTSTLKNSANYISNINSNDIVTASSGSGSGLYNRRGGGALEITEQHGAVWNYLKSLGLSDAGAAALMGNVQHESGMKFNTVEHQSLKQAKPGQYQGHDYYNDFGINYDANSYTAAVDAGMAQGLEGSESTNLSPKQGIIPKYEFTHMPWKTSKKKPDGTYFGQNGYGLCQWTTAGRKEGLYNLAKANNKSISDPTVQLQFLLNELQNGYSGVYNTLKSSNDVKDATSKFYYDFEGPGSTDTSLPTRQGYAQAFYDQFTKNPPSNSCKFGDLTVTTTASTVDGGTSSNGVTGTSNGTFSFKQLYQQMFANAFAKAAESSGNDNDKSFFGKLGQSIKNIFSGNSNSGSTNTVVNALNGNVTPQYGGTAKAAPTGNGTAASLVQIAQSQLGVTEGGENNAGNITDYGKFLGMDGEPWCASFVSWLMDKAVNGDVNKRKTLLRGNMSAAVSGLWDNFKSANAMTNSPQPGDVIIFKNNGASHTGIVETVNGNTITSIEGNTGSGNEYERNGGVVARHSWTLGDGSTLDKKLTGFGRPNWDALKGSGSGLRIGGSSYLLSREMTSESYDESPKYGGIAKAAPAGHFNPLSMVNIARSQIGVTEGGTGENGEPNAGNITDYGKFMNMDQQPWCASFVSWLSNRTVGGDPSKMKTLLRGNPSAAVSGLWQNFKDHKAMTNDPQPGDVVIFKNNGASHTGIVESVEQTPYGTRISTIEGNTGSANEYERNGGVVARHTWTLGDGSTLDKKLTGFGRPDWDAIKASGSGIIDFRKTNYEKRIGGSSGVNNDELMEKLADIIKLLGSGVQGDAAIVQAIKSLSMVTAANSTGQGKEISEQVTDQMDIMIAKLNKISTSL